MTLALVLRIALFLAIGVALFLGVRRIWRDWNKQFRSEEEAIHKRDLEEREKPDVITLKRDKDGTFRPPDDRR